MSGTETPGQAAVNAALDMAAPTATGDFATVLNALSLLNTKQERAALNAISGQNYAGFSNGLVRNGQLFMGNVSMQAGSANRARGAQRVVLSEACDVACDTTEPALWGVWGGPTAAVGKGGDKSIATYNTAGFAAGIDRQIAPEILLGFAVGYSSGNEWASGFSGRASISIVQTGLYGSFLKGPFYVDGLAGYAYSDNQMIRQIAIPGLQTRTASGNTGANQLFGQVEAGYRHYLGGIAEAHITPFTRLQGSSATQNGFTETGADSLNLIIAGQTTNSLRTIVGGQIGGVMDMGWRDKLAAHFNLGWIHEFANTDRPVTAAFIGAPAVPFTTYGASPNRNGVVIGFNASTAVAERTSAYVRYEAELSGQDSIHSATAGIRLTW